jgi:hypothetical protein
VWKRWTDQARTAYRDTFRTVYDPELHAPHVLYCLINDADRADRITFAHNIAFDVATRVHRHTKRRLRYVKG